ncbi:hypothetical protein D3C77_489360 [compost metagenome]
MLFQQQRDAGRYGITGLNHVLDELFPLFAFIEAQRYCIDNRRAPLMQAIKVDILRLQLAGFEQLLQVRRHLDQREVVDLAPVHEKLAIGRTQMLRTRPITAEQRLAQLPGRVLTHPGGSGGITEQHGGVAVFGVNDLRVRVGSDQQAVFQACRLHETLHRVNAVHITRAAQ